MATERSSPSGSGPQRVLTVASGGWMLSYVADVAVNVGGERYALVNPGNHELMLSGVAWLAAWVATRHETLMRRAKHMPGIIEVGRFPSDFSEIRRWGLP